MIRRGLIALCALLLAAQVFACRMLPPTVEDLVARYPDLTVLRGSLSRGDGGTLFHAEKLVRGQAALGDYQVIAQWHDEGCQLYEDSTPMSYPANGVLLDNEWAQYLLVYKVDRQRRILYVPDYYHYGLPVVEDQKVLTTRISRNGKYDYLPQTAFEQGVNANPVNLRWQTTILAP